MKPVIVVRRSEKKDDFQIRELIQEFVMSCFRQAFIFCLFREITLQLIVLFWAICFIFFGIPLIYCICSVPLVVLLMAICVYFSHYNKAIEMANMNPPICWITEVYEPYINLQSKMETEYIEMTETELPTCPELKSMKRKIVATLAVKNHHSLHESAWINRLAVSPKYPFNRVAKPLIEAAMKNAHENNIYSCETVCQECQEDARELYLKLGFHIRQIYHKSIIGSSLRVMKAQMGIDLDKWSRQQKNNLNK